MARGRCPPGSLTGAPTAARSGRTAASTAAGRRSRLKLQMIRYIQCVCVCVYCSIMQAVDFSQLRLLIQGDKSTRGHRLC